MIENIEYFFRWHWRELITVVVIVLALSVVVGVIVGAERRHDEFMEQCMEDHKEYECVILWRQGSRSSIVPIIIPTVSP